jgi:protoheme IX farnesyltransferase
LLGYAVIYTGFLKRATPQNIVIGLAGAAPLLGWVAVTGHISAEPLLLVIIFACISGPWRSTARRYAKANIPICRSPWRALHQGAYPALHLDDVCRDPAALCIHVVAALYLVCAVVLGGRFLHWAVVLYRDSKPHAAISTFKYSIWYLFALSPCWSITI